MSRIALLLLLVCPALAQAEVISFKHPEYMEGAVVPDIVVYEERGLTLSGAMYLPNDSISCSIWTNECTYDFPDSVVGHIRVYANDGGYLNMISKRPIERFRYSAGGPLPITMFLNGMSFVLPPTNTKVDVWIRDFVPQGVSILGLVQSYQPFWSLDVYEVEVPEPSGLTIVGLAMLWWRRRTQRPFRGRLA